VRLFAALDLPAGLVLPDPEGERWRPVPPANRHVTLVFIGEAAAPPPFEDPPPRAPLRLAGTVLLPPRRPRVLAIRLEDPTGAHTAHQARLARALGRVEDRPWLPHVTVARARDRRGVRSAHPTSADLPSVPEIELTPPSATLYASRGGRYEALVTLPAQD
jgi:2'-5' RNA ligase